MPVEGLFGERICRHLDMRGALIAGIKHPLELPFSVTHIHCPKVQRERTAPIPAEDAFSILHQLRDIERHACWIGGLMRFSGAFAAGTVSVVDLRANPQCEFTGPFEALQFYVPRQVLEDFFREHNGGSVRTLHWPRDQLDETLVGLSRVLLSVARQPAAANRLFVEIGRAHV